MLRLEPGHGCYEWAVGTVWTKTEGKRHIRPSTFNLCAYFSACLSSSFVPSLWTLPHPPSAISVSLFYLFSLLNYCVIELCTCVLSWLYVFILSWMSFASRSAHLWPFYLGFPSSCFSCVSSPRDTIDPFILCGLWLASLLSTITHIKHKVWVGSSQINVKKKRTNKPSNTLDSKGCEMEALE